MKTYDHQQALGFKPVGGLLEYAIQHPTLGIPVASGLLVRVVVLNPLLYVELGVGVIPRL